MKRFFLIFMSASSLIWAQSMQRHPIDEPSMIHFKGNPQPSESPIIARGIGEYTRISPNTNLVDLKKKTLTLCGWRGERVSTQFAVQIMHPLQGDLYFSCAGIENKEGRRLPVQVSIEHFTKSGDNLLADIITEKQAIRGPIQTHTRPIHVEINIPECAQPGTYTGKIQISWRSGNDIELPIDVQVQPEQLPSPDKWNVHLDLWQHPQAVAGWHRVEPWSDEHFLLLKPLMTRLAQAGQKTITCSLIDEAWNGQTYDWWPSMIQWTMETDGTMKYDYSIFDRWVTFMYREIGIQGQISCYTMIPWNLKIRYFDKTTDTYQFLDLKPGDASFEAIWGPFLTDFRQHVKSKGWLEKTCISLDERPDHMVRAAKDVLEKYAPEFRIVSAINQPTELTQDLYDISVAIQHTSTILGNITKERQKKGFKTSFYVCCSPEKPNTFTHSSLAESEWLPLFAAANNLDGFLRWAYQSWNQNPFETTDFGSWPSGDCFLVYPGNLSSLRFEKLRDGLEEFEKIVLLRSRAQRNPVYQKAVDSMNNELKALFTPESYARTDYEAIVMKAKEIISKTTAAMR